MTTSEAWDHSRRIAATASVLTVIAVTAGLLALALGTNVPQAWWPHTGQAFASDTRPGRGQDPRDPVAAVAKEHCQPGTTHSASAKRDEVAAAAWQLVPAGAGLAALTMWQRRRAAGQRRH